MPITPRAPGASTSSQIGDPELFGAPSLWRARAAIDLHLSSDELIAAMSPGPAYPATLATIANAVTAELGRDLDVVVDLGAGTGGASEWFRAVTGARVIAVEPSEPARTAARVLFPRLMVVPGEAARTGLPVEVADVVLASGLLSLVDVIDPVLDEMRRLLRPRGMIAVADLFASGRDDLCSGPNVFRSFEAMGALLERHGCHLVEVGCGVAPPSPEWAVPAARVDRWIHERFAHHPAYVAWRADQEHLATLMASGALLGGCLVARLDDA